MYAGEIDLRVLAGWRERPHLSRLGPAIGRPEAYEVAVCHQVFDFYLLIGDGKSCDVFQNDSDAPNIPARKMHDNRNEELVIWFEEVVIPGITGD